LWLVPPNDVTDKLRTIMDMKTPSHKSPSSFPHFHPHITLATVPSDFDLKSLRQAVPVDQAALPVTFKAVEVGDKYFMSVYVTVNQNGLLGLLREHLVEALGESTVPPKAHVSLFYIDDSEPEERTKMMDELVKQKRIVDVGDERVALDCSEVPGTRSEDVLDEFLGGEIWLVLCDGPVETWSIKDKIVLQ
jgi:2',3'-cyclic-nucleotide 3'-phosphodiesterase